MRRLAVALMILSAASACLPSSRSHTGAEPPGSIYFGQPVPGLVPERFAPGVVGTDAIELNGVFTPDFREFYWVDIRILDRFRP